MRKTFGFFEELQYDTETKKITVYFHNTQCLPDGNNTILGHQEYSSPEEYFADAVRKDDDSYVEFLKYFKAEKTAKILNATPHPIVIITNAAFNPTIRKWVVNNDPEIVATIEPTGMLSAKIESKNADPINNIPVFDKDVVGCDDLPPEMTQNDIIVVSALYATAYRRMHGNDDRIYTIADPVYTLDGKTILGSRGICPAF